MASDLTLTSASDHVPDELYNFIVWATGYSDELPPENSRVPVKDNISRKILSICQDIINISMKTKKSILLPKHCALAMAVKNMTGHTI